jgi:hypothetical protein
LDKEQSFDLVKVPCRRLGDIPISGAFVNGGERGVGAIAKLLC